MTNVEPNNGNSILNDEYRLEWYPSWVELVFEVEFQKNEKTKIVRCGQAWFCKD